MSRETETVERIRKDVVLRLLWEYTPSEVVDIIDRVADAVRRESAVGTCKNTLANKTLFGLFGEPITEIFECSECYTYWRCESNWILRYGENTIHQPNYCPNCGRKVER